MTSVVPSDEKANELISPLDTLRVLCSNHFRVCELYDHNLIVLSSLAHARYWPSGEKTSAFSDWEYVWSTSLVFSVKFQARNLLSWAVLKRTLLFGENAIDNNATPFSPFSVA